MQKTTRTKSLSLLLVAPDMQLAGASGDVPVDGPMVVALVVAADLGEGRLAAVRAPRATRTAVVVPGQGG